MTLSNDARAAVGVRIVIPRIATADHACSPPVSTAVLSARQLTLCCPTPESVIVAVAGDCPLSGNVCETPSTLQSISPTPDGPAVAVAVICAAAAPTGTSVGPESTTVGVPLSILTVLLTVAVFPAALVAVAAKVSSPSGNFVVSTLVARDVDEHCFQAARF